MAIHLVMDKSILDGSGDDGAGRVGSPDIPMLDLIQQLNTALAFVSMQQQLSVAFNKAQTEEYDRVLRNHLYTSRPLINDDIINTYVRLTMENGTGNNTGGQS